MAPGKPARPHWLGQEGSRVQSLYLSPANLTGGAEGPGLCPSGAQREAVGAQGQSCPTPRPLPVKADEGGLGDHPLCL